MISPRPNFIWSGIREKAMQPYRNIHFAHTDLSGIALFEEAFYHGLRAAARNINARAETLRDAKSSVIDNPTVRFSLRVSASRRTDRFGCFPETST